MAKPDALTALPYLGGKSPLAPQRVGRWIAEQLPYDVNYAEPFAGMLGVLLHRRASGTEIVNDVDGLVANWWTVVRDQPEQFADLVDRCNLVSEFQYEWSKEHLYSDDALESALAFSCLQITQASSGAFRLAINKGAPKRGLFREQIWALADRMRSVQVLNRDACDLLDRLQELEMCVIYVDPPYRSTAGHKIYREHTVDWDRLTTCLLAQKGKVAVSGYADEWDHLGWRCTEKETYASHIANSKTDGVVRPQPKRVEKLWMNYDSVTDSGII